MTTELGFFVRVARVAVEALQAELAKRDERIKHLEALIDSAEFAGCCGDNHSRIVCPWCDAGAPATQNKISHASDCPSFSAPGVVRTVAP